MCEADWTRREMLTAAVGGLGALALSGCGRPSAAAGAAPAAPLSPGADLVEPMPGLFVHRRAAWGGDLPPKAAIERDDVRFLLVHHTASSNTYTDPRPVIRATYGYHTGPVKRWPDVAYHFFVARDGSVWEGRHGSLDGGFEASASGGNQGWAQLVCLIGNHVDVPPTPAAQDSLVLLLKWLTWRYRLPTDPSATTEYASRGSDKYPAGTVVTTPVVAGHRDATYTACPGDAAYALLPTWRQRVADLADPVFADDGALRRAERLGKTRVAATP